jgi:hypothetical protein
MNWGGLYVARIDYGQVPSVRKPNTQKCWLIYSYGTLKKSKEDFKCLKWIENKYLNSANKSVPGYALVGIRKSSGKWGIIKIWEVVK